MRKKLLSIVLCLCLALIPAAAFAADPEAGAGSSPEGIAPSPLTGGSGTPIVASTGGAIMLEGETYTSDITSAGLKLGGSEPFPSDRTVYKAGDGYAVFTPAKAGEPAALTLINASITPEGDCDAIRIGSAGSDEAFKIVIEGNCSISNTGGSINKGGIDCSIPLTICGSGNLELCSSGDAIEASKGLTVADYSGALTLESENSSAINVYQGSLYVKTGGALTLTSDGINIPAVRIADAVSDIQIISGGNLTIKSKASYCSAVYMEGVGEDTALSLISENGDIDILGKLKRISEPGGVSKRYPVTVYAEKGSIGIESSEALLTSGESSVIAGNNLIFPDNPDIYGYNDSDLKLKGYIPAGERLSLYYLRLAEGSSLINDGNLNLSGTYLYPKDLTGVSGSGEINVDGKVYVYSDGKWIRDITDSGLCFGEGMYDDVVPSEETAYKAGYGFIVFTPATGDARAKFTLKNVLLEDRSGITVKSDLDMPISIELVGENTVPSIEVWSEPEIFGSGSLNGLVLVSSMQDDMTIGDITVYGNAALRDSEWLDAGRSVYGPFAFETLVNIPSGTSLTVSDSSTFEIKDPDFIAKEGDLINDGMVILYVDPGTSDEMIQNLINSYNLTGSGTVIVRKDSEGTGSALYTNSGIKLNVPAEDDENLDEDGDLDLSNAEKDKSGNGYAWDAEKKILTLTNFCFDNTIIVPDEAEIVTETDSKVYGINVGEDSVNKKLVFSGEGALTVDRQINSDGEKMELIVSEGAKLNLPSGIDLGTPGGVDGLLRVDGLLNVSARYNTAVSCGRVVIGSSGQLNVSGQGGVSLSGMDKNGSLDFDGAFTIESGGTFNADCKAFNLMVFTGYTEQTEESAKRIISLPDNYLPRNYSVRIVSGDNGGMQYAVTVAEDGSELVLVYGNLAGEGAVGKLSLVYRPVFTITVEASEGGSAYADPVSAEASEEIRLTAAAENGWFFKEWQVISGRVTILDDSFVMPAENVAVKAVFEADDDDDESESEPGGGSGEGSGGEQGSESGEGSGSESGGEQGGESGEGSGSGSGEGSGSSGGTSGGSSSGGSHEASGERTDNPFTDVPDDAYYADSVIWAVNEGITDGTSASTFNPGGISSRAQVVTFMWRMAGSPSPKTDTMPFDDVLPGVYYYNAVLWAAENGITSGSDEKTFAPGKDCSRAQIVTFLWRFAGSPASAFDMTSYIDFDSAPEYSKDALRWAAEKGIVSGTAEKTLNHKGIAVRVQVAVMLKRLSSL